MDSRVVVRFGGVVSEFLQTGGNDHAVTFIIYFDRQRAPAAFVRFGTREAFERIEAAHAVIRDADAHTPGFENHSVPVADGEGGLRPAAQFDKCHPF